MNENLTSNTVPGPTASTSMVSQTQLVVVQPVLGDSPNASVFLKFREKWRSYVRAGGRNKVFMGLSDRDQEDVEQRYAQQHPAPKSLADMSDEEVWSLLQKSFEFTTMNGAIAAIQGFGPSQSNSEIFSTYNFNGWFRKLKELIVLCVPAHTNKLHLIKPMINAIISLLMPKTLKDLVEVELGTTTTTIEALYTLIDAKVIEYSKESTSVLKFNNNLYGKRPIGHEDIDEVQIINNNNTSKKAKNDSVMFASGQGSNPDHSFKKQVKNKNHPKQPKNQEAKSNINTKGSDQSKSAKDYYKPSDNSASTSTASKGKMFTSTTSNNTNTNSSSSQPLRVLLCPGCGIKWEGDLCHSKDECPLKTIPGWGNPADPLSNSFTNFKIVKKWSISKRQ